MRRLLIGIPVFSLAIAVAIAGAVWLLRGSPDPIVGAADEYKHSLVRWEIRHFLGKWLYEFGALIRRDSLSLEQENERLISFFALTQEIADRERQLGALPPDSADGAELHSRLEELRGRRQRLENTVEAIIESRVGELLAEQGLGRELPLVGRSFLWPPVDIEFDNPPNVLVVSPRDRITQQKLVLLRGNLPIETVLELEAEVERHGLSALVVSTGGIATYPSTIPATRSYSSILDTAAHEWIHQYLFFYPLGRRYFDSEGLRTINETVANIVGQEIGQMVAERYPLSAPARGSPTTAAVLVPSVSFRDEMRTLRLDVDRLLAEGKIDEAERLMKEKRDFLAEHGYYIRKINQAYFAWYGVYADGPAASSPLGPKIIEIRELSGSVGEFVRRMAQVTSTDDVDRLLAELRQAATTPP